MHHVFVDSNVLGSKTLYDWLFLLRRETDSLFTLSASDDVLDEAHRVWRRRHPTANGAMRTKREALFRSSLDEVVGEWAGGTAPVKDVDDTHVHNAAVSVGADIVLTRNVGDFGDLDALPYDLYTPDEFFCLIYASDAQSVETVTEKQEHYWLERSDKHRTVTFESLSDALLTAGCPEFASIVNQCSVALRALGVEP